MKLASHPILNTRRTRTAAANTMAAAIATASFDPAAVTASTPAPNTGAVTELGPSVTCLDVVNSE